MYIIAIGWLYVVVMMSITETSFIAGLMTFLFYGLVPLAVFLWLFGTPQRRRSMAAKEKAGKPDGTDTKPD
ncbi:MAG: hypothetical protein Q7U63_11715 [Polaromonas sp.]|uniref:hypothetical protein n=1 Tax=Polaromonas sp. TaxID=1869339 RepID=UPI00271781BF|nr:hypothetical protein [Polaromonas sp.]MDO9114445.1 hypothetical protein [Polaromonas sp.]MDP1704919.1 hypothetical protein [Sulfurimicrobium sp.]MDP2197524.1 hypothetical protein [Sulfurimicrobium sp.]MDP3687149.1 hypothetical protein [Sulfurimicrobium sp.]